MMKGKQRPNGPPPPLFGRAYKTSDIFISVCFRIAVDHTEKSHRVSSCPTTFFFFNWRKRKERKIERKRRSKSDRKIEGKIRKETKKKDNIRTRKAKEREREKERIQEGRREGRKHRGKKERKSPKK